MIEQWCKVSTRVYEDDIFIACYTGGWSSECNWVDTIKPPIGLRKINSLWEAHIKAEHSPKTDPRCIIRANGRLVVIECYASPDDKVFHWKTTVPIDTPPKDMQVIFRSHLDEYHPEVGIK